MKWTGSAKTIATVSGLPVNVLFNDVLRAENLPWNIIAYEDLEA